MKTKIKWFKEVLELEPGSKVFFPLARLYYEDGELDEAQLTLAQGLERNPDHLEARFLMVEILSGLGRDKEAVTEVRTITGMLSSYPAFWKVWAEAAAPASKDSAMALSFLAANFQGSPISWSQVIEKGLDALFHNNGAPLAAAEDAPAATSAPKSKAEEEDACDPETNLRTRTMADLLAEQGDHQGALDIYEELVAKCGPDESDELQTLIGELRAKLDPGTAETDEPEDSDTLDETVAEFIGELTGSREAAAELEIAEAPAAEEESGIEEQAAEPASVEEAVAANLPGKEQLLETLEALAERLEARSSL